VRASTPRTRASLLPLHCAHLSNTAYLLMCCAANTPQHRACALRGDTASATLPRGGKGTKRQAMLTLKRRRSTRGNDIDVS